MTDLGGTAEHREDVKFVGSAEAIGELFDALAKAQGEFKTIVKDSEATVTVKAGGNYKFAYAGLDVVIAATQPALSRHGLAFVQLPTSDTLVSVLGYKGARIESIIGFSGVTNAQEYGSKITYLKRYARLSMLSVFPADEDDDANASIGNKADVVKRHPPTTTKAAPPADAVTPQTVARVLKLAKDAGFQKAELEEFSKKAGCGPLDGQTEINGLRLVVALEKLEASR